MDTIGIDNPLHQTSILHSPLWFKKVLVSHENETAAKSQSHFWFQNWTVLTKE